jgi:hypothetical protein
MFPYYDGGRNHSSKASAVRNKSVAASYRQIYSQKSRDIICPGSPLQGSA